MPARPFLMMLAAVIAAGGATVWLGWAVRDHVALGAPGAVLGVLITAAALFGLWRVWRARRP